MQPSLFNPLTDDTKNLRVRIEWILARQKLAAAMTLQDWLAYLCELLCLPCYERKTVNGWSKVSHSQVPYIQVPVTGGDPLPKKLWVAYNALLSKMRVDMTATYSVKTPGGTLLCSIEVVKSESGAKTELFTVRRIVEITI